MLLLITRDGSVIPGSVADQFIGAQNTGTLSLYNDNNTISALLITTQMQTPYVGNTECNYVDGFSVKSTLVQTLRARLLLRY